MTSVEEWTRADTGVGAAIAAGNHLENGICALLVIAARVTAVRRRGDIGVVCMLVISQWPWLIVHAIARSSMASPIRFVSAVIIPAARDLGFW